MHTCTQVCKNTGTCSYTQVEVHIAITREQTNKWNRDNYRPRDDENSMHEDKIQ